MKKIISVLLSVNILFSICIGLNFSAFAETITGKAGENSTYSFDKETGTLIVSGTGAVDFLDAPEAGDFEIHSIIVEEGITSCDFQYLFGIGALKQIKYSSTVKDPNLFFLNDLVSSGSVSSLSEIVVDKNNPYYSSDDGVLYNKDITKLLVYPIGKNAVDYELPDTVSSVSEGVFGSSRPNYLRNINVSENNKYFSSVDGALFNKDKTRLIKKIIDYNEKEYKIPDSVKIISDYALTDFPFFGHTIDNKPINFKLTIPESISSFEGSYAIGDSIYDVDIYYEGNIEQWKNISGVDKLKSYRFNMYYLSPCDTHTEVIDGKIEPTCTTSGLTEGKHCSVCGVVLVKQEIIPALGHNYEVIDSKKNSCTEDGYKTYKCNTCGATNTEQLLATGHDYEVIDSKNVTCETDGYKKYKCKTCGFSYTETLKAIGHKYNVVDYEEANCVDDGYKKYVCENCGDTYTEYIFSNGHDYIESLVKPTCSEKGYTLHTCVICSYSYKDNYVGELGHKFEETGRKYNGDKVIISYTCTVCSATKTEQAEHIHTWSDWKYNGDAVYNSSKDYKNGTRTHTCSVCGVSETEEAPNTALLRKRGNALALESNITLATYVGKDVVDYYDEVYAEITRNGKTTRVYPSEKTLSANSTEYNIFDYKGISPQALGDEISITVYGIKDGTTYWGNTATYSATDYIKSTLADSSTDTDLKTLLVDLVYYGEACQMYQGYNTDKPLTDILTDKQKTFRSTGDLTLTNIKSSSYATCDNRLVKLGTALRLSDSVELAISLNMTDVTVNDLTMKVKVGNRTLSYSYAENPECFELGKDGYWYFYFNGLYANQLSDEVFITAYRGEEQVSYTLRYSAESYAATVKDEKLKAVTDAMMRYGNSAKAYKQGYRAWR